VSWRELRRVDQELGQPLVRSVKHLSISAPAIQEIDGFSVALKRLLGCSLEWERGTQCKRAADSQGQGPQANQKESSRVRHRIVLNV
jgi:hypothetical protein